MSNAARSVGMADMHYAHVMSRLSRVNTIGALAIIILTVLLVRHNRTSVAIVAGSFLVLTPLNWWITTLLKTYTSAAIEPLRVTVNLGASLVTNHLIGWPLSNWLWLPFIAIAFDGFRPRTTWFVLLVTCTANDLLGLYDGVPWIYPTIATMFACYARVVTEKRLSIISDMFRRSEEQRCSLDDAHASLQRAVEAQRRAETDLRQSQKLEAVGRLAAGVAHEMNTPLQFVCDSIAFIEQGVDEFLRLNTPSAKQGGNMAFVCENLPSALQMTNEGLMRVTSIVRALKEFARPNELGHAPVNLNHSIETTLVIAKHEYKYVADVEMHLGEIPRLVVHGGEINQVILNLVVNAAHAISDAKRVGVRGRIMVSTRCEGDEVVLVVADNGVGIPEATREKIFEPFFTTKDVGRGTGQGLAIARSIIERHHGTLKFESTIGEGSAFYVRLPIDRGDAGSEAA